MTSFLFLGGTPSTFKLDVELNLTERDNDSADRLVDVSWTEQNSLEIVQTKLKKALEGAAESGVCAWCELIIRFGASGEVLLEIRVKCKQPRLTNLSFSRETGTGACDERFVSKGLADVDVSTVERLKSYDGYPFFLPGVLDSGRWTALTHLHLTGSGITALPIAIGHYTSLRELRLSNNKLKNIPKEIGFLSALEVLVADHNQLVSIPADLSDCSKLQDLNLEFNSLSAVVLDLERFPWLHSLQLYGNPLKYIPELSVCRELQSLSLMNLRVWSDASHSQFEVTIEGTTTLSWGTKLSPLFSVIFSRSSSQHPLLAGALGRLAEYRSNCDAIMDLPGAPLQQLILMVLSPNHVVQEQTTKVIGLMVQSVKTAQTLVKSGIQGAMLSILDSDREDTKYYALKALSALAMIAESIAVSLMVPKLVEKLRQFMEITTSTRIRHLALKTLGNLSFPTENKTRLSAETRLREALRSLAHGQPAKMDHVSRLLACRCLAILGESRLVESIVGRPPIKGRGVRILSIDGGGMKGLSAIKMLKELEKRTGRRTSDLFDLIGGTSSGAMLAVALGILQFSLEQIEDVYKKLGRRVFNQAQQEDTSGWRESLKRIYRSGQQGLRVVMAGCKHDASTFEALLQEWCKPPGDKSIGSLYIDSAVLPGPKVFAASTLTSIIPAVPFIFRNYELAAVDGDPAATGVQSCLGSSKFDLWQGVRASSAAPYFFEDFKLDDLHFQDGAMTANNPTTLAVQQARLLWPDIPIDCVVSIGLGSVPAAQREKSNSSLIDNGSVLIESSCSVERTHEVVSLMAAMTPGMHYFRFSPVDKRCDLALDDLDAAKWSQLEAATMDYMEKNRDLFKQAASILMSTPGVASPTGDPEPGEEPKRKQPLLVVQALCKEEGGHDARSPLHFLENCVGTAELDAMSLRPQVGYRGNRVLDKLELASEPPPPSELQRGISFLSTLLQKLTGQIGALHLELETLDGGEKLVVSRSSSIWSISDPSSEASRLRFVIGVDEEASLGEALRRRRYFNHFGNRCRLISEQSLFFPSATSIYMFERLEVSESIGGREIREHLELKDVLVTSPWPLARDLVFSLLSSGASAVCCRSPDAPRVSIDDGLCFFKSFYDCVYSGSAPHVALKQSESILPHLTDRYQLFHSHT